MFIKSWRKEYIPYVLLVFVTMLSSFLINTHIHSRMLNKGKRVSMAEESRRVLKGCIKASRGPWLVHKTTKDGGVVTKLRFPSDRERQNNRQRERTRRAVVQKIFAGLKAHGNYQLPKHPDTNDLLMALCREAGWLVEEDGNVHRKNSLLKMPSLINIDDCSIGAPSEDEEYCECGVDVDSEVVGNPQPGTITLMEPSHEERDMNLALSLSNK